MSQGAQWIVQYGPILLQGTVEKLINMRHRVFKVVVTVSSWKFHPVFGKHNIKKFFFLQYDVNSSKTSIHLSINEYIKINNIFS